MKAIQTRFFGPTNTKGARIKAWAKPKLPPKQFVFVPGQKPCYPQSYFTRFVPPVRKFPRATDIRTCISQFNALNHPPEIDIEYVSAMGECHV